MRRDESRGPLSSQFEGRFFDISVDLLCVVGMDGRFRRINPAWEDTLGFSLTELMSRPAVELIHPDDRQSSRDLGALLRDGRDVVHFENRYVTKDGGHRWIAWTCRATREDGEIVVYGAGRDVTEQRLADRRAAAS